MRVALAVLATMAGVGWGQTPSPAPLAPSSFYAGGMSGMVSTSPKPTGWTAVATPTKAGSQVWSVSGLDYTLTSKKQIQSVAWTSVATQSTTVKGIQVFVLAGAGAATTGQSAGYSLTTATIFYLPLRKGAWGGIVAGYGVYKSSAGGGTQDLWKVGWGRNF